MVNSPLIRPYFLGGGEFRWGGGPLDSPDHRLFLLLLRAWIELCTSRALFAQDLSPGNVHIYIYTVKNKGGFGDSNLLI